MCRNPFFGHHQFSVSCPLGILLYQKITELNVQIFSFQQIGDSIHVVLSFAINN
jgi:hypothetical protein